MRIITYNIFYLIILFLFTSTVHSQVSYMDSIKNEVETNPIRDTNRINNLYKLAFASFQQSEQATLAYLKEVEDLSDSLNYTLGKAKLHYLKGILQSRKSNYPESLNLFNKSLEYYKLLNDEDGMSAIYTAFGITNFVQSRYEEALINYTDSYNIHKDLDNQRELITDLVNIGNVYLKLGKYDDAISNYNRALEISDPANDKGIISSLNTSIGVVYKNQGNYPLAINYYNKTLAYNKENKDTLGIAISNNNLGDAYTSANKFDEALKYHLLSLKYAEQIGSKSLIATNTNNIGNIYLNKDQNNKALEYYNTSLKTSKEINQLEQALLCYHNIGELNLKLNKSKKARENFINAEDISNKIGSKRGLSYSLLGVAESYLIENNNDEAFDYAQRGKALANELDIMETEIKAEELLFNIYNNTKQYKKAFESHQQYKILNDSLFNKENIERITQLEYEYKYKQKIESANNRELKLTKKVEVTSSNLEKSQRNLLLGVILFLSITILLGVIIFYLRVRNVKAETQNIIVEQKLLRSQMTPHFIFNALSVLQGIILNKEDKKAVSYLSKFSKLLRVTLENSRDQMVSLNNELIAIEKYIELQNIEASTPFIYSISVDSNIDKELFKIPPMLIQPFIENSIEHGFINQTDDKQISISISFTNNELNCTILDNGVGINALKTNQNQNKKSLSTAITSERLEIISKNTKSKGSVIIEDREKYNEQGTLVLLNIPYKIESA